MTVDLPEIIPLFPLPNVVLFPEVDLPLHIFEPRYRAMVDEVTQSHGIIGMLLLTGDWEREYYGYPEVFAVGCAGRIERLVRLPDGRFNLVLRGVSEFKIVREIRDRAYRQAEVIWCPAKWSLENVGEDARQALLKLLYKYVSDDSCRTWRDLAEKKRLGSSQLVNLLSLHLDLTPLEKQTLLEALDQRLERLIDVLTFKLAERKFVPPGAGGFRTAQ